MLRDGPPAPELGLPPIPLGAGDLPEPADVEEAIDAAPPEDRLLVARDRGGEQGARLLIAATPREQDPRAGDDAGPAGALLHLLGEALRLVEVLVDEEGPEEPLARDEARPRLEAL